MRIAQALLTVALLLSPQVSFACETRNLTISGNLNSTSAIIGSLPLFDEPIDQQLSVAQAAGTVRVYDTIGTAHTLWVLLYHVGTSTWISRIVMDSGEVVGGSVGNTYFLADIQLTFDSAGNREYFLDLPDYVAMIRWSNGSRESLFDITVRPITQLNAPTIVSPSQDGGTGSCTQRGHLDFDGDGVDDLAVWRRQYGMWAILKSSTNNTDYIWKQWGLPGDYPMAGDYTGDDKADLMVWRPTNGNWYVCTSDTDFDCTGGVARQFGLLDDRPVRGDFDGDTVLDLAVWRPNLGMFFYLSSRTNEIVMRQWGLPGDIPLDAGVSR